MTATAPSIEITQLLEANTVDLRLELVARQLDRGRGWIGGDRSWKARLGQAGLERENLA